MKKIFQILLTCLLIAVIVFAVLHTISWHDAMTSIRALRWESIALIIAIVIATSVVKATRFFCILHYGGVNISWLNAQRIFIASLAFTPIPAGEVGRAMLFKHELDIHLAKTTGPVFLQALMEIWSAALWIVVVAFFVGYALGWWIVGLVGLLAVLTAPLFWAHKLVDFLDWMSQCGATYGWITKTRSTFLHFNTLVSSTDKKRVWQFWVTIIILALIVHALNGSLIWYIAHIEGVQLSFLQATFAAAMAGLIQGVLAIIPGGLGVTEGGLVGIFTGFGIEWQKTILITLLYRVATLPLAILIAMIFLVPIYTKNIFAFIHIKENKV